MSKKQNVVEYLISGESPLDDLDRQNRDAFASKPPMISRNLSNFVTVIRVLRFNIRQRAVKKHATLMREIIPHIIHGPPRLRKNGERWFPGGVMFQETEKEWYSRLANRPNNRIKNDEFTL